MSPQFTLTPYRLPLRMPWRTARGVRTEREGWLVQACWQGCRGYGDCAPLPEAGTETPIAAWQRLSTWPRDHRQSSLETQLALLERQIPSSTPAADAALETALLDLSARLSGLTLHAYLLTEPSCAGSRLAELNPRPPPQPKPTLEGKLDPHDPPSDPVLAQAPRQRVEIRLNAALGAVTDLQPEQSGRSERPMPLEQPDPCERLERALAAGFRVLKVKVGIAPIERELAAIQHLCARLPADVRLRLDANGAWSLATAGTLLEDLRPIANRIECLEEPCAGATDTQLRTLQSQAPFALALDESLPARGWPLDPRQLPLRRIVLKPGVIGGLRPTLALAQGAQAAGLEVVITSLIESAAGLWSSAQLAAATGSSLAHGLATADWLAADLGPAPDIKEGRIQLPRCPGSGFVYVDA